MNLEKMIELTGNPNLTQKEWYQFLKLNPEIKEEYLKPEKVHSVEEEAYRRGYAQGFFASRNSPDVSIQEVQAWRHSDKKTCPPGSAWEGREL